MRQAASWLAPRRVGERRSMGLDRTPLVIALLFVLLHALLAAGVDASDPDVFVRADRAVARLQALHGLLASASAGEIVQYLAGHGIVGDYAAHAVLYLLGGRAAVVGVQVALAILSGLCVYQIGSWLGLSRRMSALAMTIYLCMPHVLVFPHQLASEALHMPLLVISTWMLAKGVIDGRLPWLVASAACLGIATLIRPITLLWPIVAAIAVLICRRPREAAIYGAAAYLPILLWMSFIGVQTGEFGLGKSDHSMERNLYERVMRITATLPPSDREAARAAHLPRAESASQRELGALGYLRFSAAYPAASLKHLLHDATAFFAKSGVERLTIDYLALAPEGSSVQDPDRGWRQQLEKHGWAHTLHYLWSTLGATLVVSLVGAIAMVGLIVLASIGAVHFVRRIRRIRAPRVTLGMLLILLVGYVFLFAQVLNAMQSRQRAPAEFAIVVLAVVGLGVLGARYEARRTVYAAGGEARRE